jgi:hypothetical protein
VRRNSSSEAKISASPRPTRLNFLDAIPAAGKHSGTELFVCSQRPPRPPQCRYSVSLLERQLHLLVVSSPTLMLLRAPNSLRRGGPVYLHHQAKQLRPRPQAIRCLAIPPPRPLLPRPQYLVLRQQCRYLQEAFSPGLARARLHNHLGQEASSQDWVRALQTTHNSLVDFSLPAVSFHLRNQAQPSRQIQDQGYLEMDNLAELVETLTQITRSSPKYQPHSQTGVQTHLASHKVETLRISAACWSVKRRSRDSPMATRLVD